MTIVFSGDVAGTNEYEAADNTDAPAFIQTYLIAAGGSGTTFIVPSTANGFGTFIPKAVTIIKPSDYTGTLILKGSSGASDAEGVYLHGTDFDSLSINATLQSAIILKASVACQIILVWS